MYRSTAFLALIACSVVTVGLRAQNQPLVLPPPAQPRTVAEHEAIQSTVRRTIEELRSEDAELRLGAAMLLGKYPGPAARDALIAALEDPSLQVRRAAVVSLLDRNFLMQPFDTRPLLAMISDDDAEIRRNVSGQAHILVSLLRSWMAQQGQTQGLFAGALPAQTRAAFTEALLDPDAVVRRNILQNQNYLGIAVDASTLRKLVLDDDLKVRLLALPIARRQLQPDSFVELLRASLDLRDPAWLIAVIQSLNQSGGEAGYEMLKTLSEHEDQRVADEAAVALFTRAPEDPRGTAFYRRLLAGELTASLAQRYIPALLYLSEDKAKAILAELLSSPDVTVRQEAARYWLLMQDRTVDVNVVVQLLEDRSPAVREVAVDYLQRRPGWINPELRDALLFSDYLEIRELAFTVAANLPQDEAAAIFSELLLDEAESLRLRAIYEFIRRRLDGWREVAGASLNDRSETLRTRVASFLLSTSDPATIAVLADFIADNPDDPLSEQIAARVQALMARFNEEEKAS